MAKKNTIQVLGAKVRFKPSDFGDFVCLSDIASTSGKRAALVVQNWMRTRATVEFLGEWELAHNEDFKGFEFEDIKNASGSNAFSMSPSEWVETVGAVGVNVIRGKYGGTFAHFDIALHFCNWLSPRFYVHIVKEFRELKQKEFSQKSLAWHLEKITANVDEVRNLLDTIPGQKPELNRMKSLGGKKDE